jgi:hypothetical protein
VRVSTTEVDGLQRAAPSSGLNPSATA